MKNEEKYDISIGILMIMISIIASFCVYFMLELKEMTIDHECYMMSDKEFYSSEQCKPYWSYRQVGKK